ncbi:MAG TPA: tail fiber domain-containing protein, partial [Bacteroidia bacterium]|nr:tail fiber domain-containing protein [Bacteroidia bacterium]
VIADGTTNVTGCNSKQSSGSTVISYYSDINNATLGANNRAYYASINATTNTTNTGYQADVLTANGTTASTVTNYGFRTTINGTVQALYSFGFHAQSYKANYNYGIRAEAIPTPGINADALSCGGYFDGGTSNVGTSVINAYGVEAYAHGGSTANYGVAGKCNGSAADNYAVYGEVIQPGAASNNYAGYFAGNVYATGTITSSDQKLKTNITAISNALNIINQLHPKLFDYLSASYPSMHLPTDTHAGLIAQDLEMVLPNLVNTARQPAVTDSNGVTTQAAVDFKGVNYQELIPYLIAAVKEQQQQIDSLANLISNNAYPKQPLQSMSVTLSNQASIILNQNDPNPFAQNTTITYSIPEEVKNAQLLIYDNNGTILKTITINEK